MKSLQESLFDKDLVKKDLKFRDVYELLAGRAGQSFWGVPIGQMFSTTKVSHYKNPYHPDILNEFWAGFLGIITDMSVPSKSDFNKGMYCDWCQKLLSKQGLGKYVRNDWKLEYDRKFEVRINDNEANQKNLISVELQLGRREVAVGGAKFTFKIKNS